jgi:NTP pyrophosphatase (non-canonical NTP hydrolase)
MNDHPMNCHPTYPTTHIKETFKHYQAQAKTTAIYDKEVALEYLSAGIAGEVGELTSIIAKQLRKGNYSRGPGGTQNYYRYPIADVKHELGDVLWFVSQIATTFGIDLAEVANANIDKLTSRKERGVIEGSGDYR